MRCRNLTLLASYFRLFSVTPLRPRGEVEANGWPMPQTGSRLEVSSGNYIHRFVQHPQARSNEPNTSSRTHTRLPLAVPRRSVLCVEREVNISVSVMFTTAHLNSGTCDALVCVVTCSSTIRGSVHVRGNRFSLI
jgi:hypothetical protein